MRLATTQRVGRVHGMERQLLARLDGAAPPHARARGVRARSVHSVVSADPVPQKPGVGFNWFEPRLVAARYVPPRLCSLCAPYVPARYVKGYVPDCHQNISMQTYDVNSVVCYQTLEDHVPKPYKTRRSDLGSPSHIAEVYHNTL